MTSKRKYGGLAIGVRAGLGAVFGVITGQMGVWLAVGVAIGVVIGLAFGDSVRPKKAECPQCAAMHRVHTATERNGND